MSKQNNDNKGFSYTYSAKEQEEIKKIRDKYTAPTESENKMARLRRLDASVTRTAEIVALVFGIIGTLTLGFGMSLCMTEIGVNIGLQSAGAVIVGAIIGILGATLASLAYPMYNIIVKRKRKKLAPEIIRLSEELMK